MSEEIEDKEISQEEEQVSEELSPAEERELAEAMTLSGESEDELSLLPDADEESLDKDEEPEVGNEEFSGTELEEYEASEIEDVEFIETEQLQSIIESILFASDRPVSLASIRQVFKGTSVKKKHINSALENLAVTYADPARGVTLEEVTGGYQLRTKVDNMEFLKKTVKGRPFKLSGPALEVLSIAAYKQPLVKVEIDEIRGVESGHLLRALMEKGLVSFAGKSELPGKPMLYQTTKKFLEIFGLRNLKELPSLSEIDSLLPEGIGDEEEKPKLADITDNLSENVTDSYSIGEEELEKISSQLGSIETSTDFFEEEKRRQREKRDRDRAQDIRDALAMGEEVADKDQKWLERYEAALEHARLEAEAKAQETAEDQETVEDQESLEASEAEENVEASTDSEEALEALSESSEDVDEAVAGEEVPLLADESSNDGDEEPITAEPVVEASPKKEAGSKKKASKDDENASSKEVVNQKLASALAAFRQGFATEEPKKEEPSSDEERPPESEA